MTVKNMLFLIWANNRCRFIT